jgi:alcohol dehydrogenase class IV
MTRLEVPAHPRVLLGPGTWHEACDVALSLAVKHVLILTTGDWKGDVITRVDHALRGVGIAVTHCSHSSSNARDSDVEASHRVFRESECDAVLSLGGGSAHDTTKAVRVLTANMGKSINDYFGRNPARAPSLVPHVAINTTSGTGAEVSSSYVYTDTRSISSPRKRFVIDRLAVPTVAINDPTLMLSQPQWLVAFSGVDALTHAIEAFTSRPTHPIAQRQAAHAARLIYDNIESAVANPNDLSAMRKMCLGQYLAGSAFSSAGLGLVHAISHALSAHFDLHHGLANGVALPYVLRYNAATAPEGYAELASLLRLGNGRESVASQADAFIFAVMALLERLHTPSSAAQALRGERVVVIPDHVRRDILMHVLEDPCIQTNARPVKGSKELSDMIRQIMG